ncbi:class I SAM-dependent methyltransferase [Candidatus Bathyarchaeota archaeon]|nr:class I SAM-dependent methyltransferase [Candidatus Bathyarchaeota archaeon]
MDTTTQKTDQPEREQHFFDFAAEAGLTKHFGGLDATEELVELCHIGEDSYVLDVGCGVGQTSCYLAKTHGCRVVGVDVNERMVERSRERAKGEGVAERTEFRVADAQDLPFTDEAFDAVITESVTVFPEDKQRAVREYARVTKPGGYVGLNEATWLKAPPPPEIIEWASQDLGAQVKPLTSDGWVELMEGAALTEIAVNVREVKTQKEANELVRRYGYGGMLLSLFRAASLYLRSPAYRRFVGEVQKEGITPDNLEEYLGYGVFVGRKS